MQRDIKVNFKIYTSVKIRAKHPLLNNVYGISMDFYPMSVINLYLVHLLL